MSRGLEGVRFVKEHIMVDLKKRFPLAKIRTFDELHMGDVTTNEQLGYFVAWDFEYKSPKIKRYYTRNTALIKIQLFFL